MKSLAVVLMVLGCKSSEPAQHTKVEPAAPPPADAPATKRELVIEVRSMHIDARTKTVVYAAEALWDGKPFNVDAATADDWQTMHEVLKTKTDAFVGASATTKAPIKHIGIYLYPNGAVPDLKKSKGDPGTTTIAFYGNLLIVGTWRFCFGGHLGTGPNMRKCIDEPVPAGAYALERP